MACPPPRPPCPQTFRTGNSVKYLCNVARIMSVTGFDDARQLHRRLYLTSARPSPKKTPPHRSGAACNQCGSLLPEQPGDLPEDEHQDRDNRPDAVRQELELLRMEATGHRVQKH